MKNFKVIIEDLGLTLESEWEAKSEKAAEKKARNYYGPELDCFPDEVDVILVTEIKK